MFTSNEALIQELRYSGKKSTLRRTNRNANSYCFSGSLEQVTDSAHQFNFENYFYLARVDYAVAVN